SRSTVGAPKIFPPCDCQACQPAPGTYRRCCRSPAGPRANRSMLPSGLRIPVGVSVTRRPEVIVAYVLVIPPQDRSDEPVTSWVTVPPAAVRPVSRTLTRRPPQSPCPSRLSTLIRCTVPAAGKHCASRATLSDAVQVAYGLLVRSYGSAFAGR